MKGDGCDLTSGLGESVSHEWSGDEDLCDGKLHCLTHSIDATSVCRESWHAGKRRTMGHLHALEGDLANDIDFLTSGLFSVVYWENVLLCFTSLFQH